MDFLQISKYNDIKKIFEMKHHLYSYLKIKIDLYLNFYFDYSHKNVNFFLYKNLSDKILFQN